MIMKTVVEGKLQIFVRMMMITMMKLQVFLLTILKRLKLTAEKSFKIKISGFMWTRENSNRNLTDDEQKVQHVMNSVETDQWFG